MLVCARAHKGLRYLDIIREAREIKPFHMNQVYMYCTDSTSIEVLNDRDFLGELITKLLWH